jgi:hypothetical protein
VVRGSRIGEVGARLHRMGQRAAAFGYAGYVSRGTWILASHRRILASLSIQRKEHNLKDSDVAFLHSEEGSVFLLIVRLN